MIAREKKKKKKEKVSDSPKAKRRNWNSILLPLRNALSALSARVFSFSTLGLFRNLV